MNERSPAAALIALVLTVDLSACATTKSEDVRTCKPAELKQSDYETVKRIWVESWRTALWVPTYSSRDDGIAVRKDKASSLNANGPINVDRYGKSGIFGGSLACTCYGKAIRVK